MRMWGVPTEKLCGQHLLGEHVEMHMFAGTIRKGIGIDGYVNNGLVQPELVYQRHEELARELVKRGFDHKSPMEPLECAPRGKLDIQKNLETLAERCARCKKIQEG